MKKILSLIVVILLAVTAGFSQSPAPGIFNYQGVARNSVGNVLANQFITLRLTIHDGLPTGPTVYQESRNVTTNPFGLFNVQVGSSGFISQTGTIAGVPWGVGDKYIQVEIDPAGGSTFINIGTARIASVPYSLYSSLANDLVLPFSKSQASASALFSITNTGTGGSGVFAVNNAAGTSDALQASTNGAASSWALRATSTGLQGAGIFQYNNGTGAANALRVLTNGTGFAANISSSNATPRALLTAGGLQLTGINEAANRILATVPGDGTATWQSPAAVGVVTGSGTVNFVPKWTPSTTNLGNSQIFDNGAQVGINTITPAYRLTVVHAGGDGVSIRGTGGFSVNDIDASNGDAALRFLNNGAFRWNIRNDPAGNDLQVFDMGAGVARMRLLTANGNLGIATGAPLYRLDVDATSAGSSNGLRVRNTTSFATVDIVGAVADQALRFGKNGVVYSGINTLPDGDHITFFKFGVGNLMAENVNTGNLGVGGAIINPVAKVHVRGFNVANNLYSSSTFFLGATGLGVNDITAQPTNEKWGIHTYVDGAVGTQHGIFAEPGTTAGLNTGLFGRVSTAPVSGQSFALFAFDPVNNGTTTWAATIRGRLQYQDGTQGLGKILRSTDAAGNASWSTLAAAGIVAGSGTLNYVPKWTPNGVTLGNSQIFDDGINVGIGTATPLQTLQVSKAPVNPAMGGQLMLENAGLPFASNTVAIDFVPIGYAFSSNIPGARMTAFDDGVFSSSLLFSTKTPGASGNPLAERMRISSGGNVGVGTTVPNTLFANNGINNLGSDATGLAARSINWSMSSAGYVQGLYNGSAASGANGLEVKVAGTTANNKILDLTTGAQNSNGNSIMVVRGDGNVGINNASPANKLDVSNANNTNAGFFENTNAANTVGALRGFNAAGNVGSWGMHALSVTSVGTGYPGEATHAALVAAATTGVGIVTSSPSNYGLRAGSITNHAIYGENYGGGGFAGVFGVSLAPGGNGVAGNTVAGTGAGGYFTGGTTALRTLGAVQLTGIGEANGYVLTSNAVGNATWQAPPTTVAFKRVGGSANLVVNSGNSADINTWNVNEYNLGGGAYNAGTGEYTVPVTGLYQVYAKTKTAGNAGTGYYNMNIRVNGVVVSAHTVPVVPNNFIQANANSAIQLNAGDIVKIEFQNSSSNNTTILNWVTYDMEFSINRIK